MIAAAPVTANSPRVSAGRLRACGLKIMNPAASPAKANAAHGKSGNNQGCGAPRLWQPSIYDSSGQGSHVGRQVVYKSGVSKAITATMTMEIAAIVKPQWLKPDPLSAAGGMPEGIP